MKQRKGWRMSCDVGKATDGLKNELWLRWSDGKVGEWALLYISISMSSAHSPSFQSLHLRHSSFWFLKLSVTSPTSQLILQPFPRFTYVTTHSPTLPLLHLRHSSFSNSSFASPTSQDFHLLHLASRPCQKHQMFYLPPCFHLVIGKMITEASVTYKFVYDSFLVPKCMIRRCHRHSGCFNLTVEVTEETSKANKGDLGIR